MAKILVVEDDRDLSKTVFDCLRSRRHTVEIAEEEGTANAILAVSRFDLIILDWQLAQGDGIELMRSYRRNKGSTPILMLTAQSSLDDKETGFAAGADDYLTKPFSMRELFMRVEALLRRPAALVDEVLSVGLITLHCGKCKVLAGEKEIHLLPKEYALLEHLLRHRGQFFTSEQLLERVWRSDEESRVETVVTTINRLRNKIDAVGKPSIIETLRGHGYRIN